MDRLQAEKDLGKIISMYYLMKRTSPRKIRGRPGAAVAIAITSTSSGMLCSLVLHSVGESQLHKYLYVCIITWCLCLAYCIVVWHHHNGGGIEQMTTQRGLRRSEY